MTISYPVIPQSVMDIADHYSKATGISCMILDVLHTRLVDDKDQIDPLLLEQLEPNWRSRCLQSHLHNAMLSERFGGSYIYFCLLSMLYWVSPVIMHGRMDYAIIAGPVLIFDHSEVLGDTLITNEALREEVELALQKIPQVEVSRIHNLSEVLRMCAGWASGYVEHRMVENRQSLLGQSRLSEFIQESKKGSTVSIQSYPLEKEAQLQEAIRWGDRKVAQKVMNELLGLIFFTNGNSLDKVNFRVMELISLLSRAAVQGGAPEEEILEMSYRFQREVGHYASLEGMSNWLAKVLHQYTDLVFASRDAEYGPMIAQAIRYIRKHYQDRITLDETAAEVGLSPNYFSRIFNEKMRISFSSYVNRLRIEQAERLLLNTTLSLIEIAGLVGFEEQSYFSKVFKGITMLSPGQYRKRAGRFPSETHEIHNTNKK